MNRVFQLTAIGLLLLCLSTACSTDNLLPDGSERVVPDEVGMFTFSLSTGSPLSVDTRVFVDALNDIWVVQLNSAGTAALVPPQRVTSITSDKKIRVKLKKEQSKTYFFVNTGKADLFNTSAALTTFTTSSVEGTTISRNSTWNDMDYMPMFGIWTGEPTVPTISGTVELTSALALLSVDVKNETAGKLKINSLQVKNIPNVLRLCPSTDATYPAATGTYIDYSPIIDEYSYMTSTYVAENCRGTGSGRYETEKTAAAVTNGAYATYCEIKGKYNYAIDVTYRFYPGGNLTNDYNVRRNTEYSVTIIIKGMNPTDMRVTVETKSLSSSSNTSITWGDGSSETVNGSI